MVPQVLLFILLNLVIITVQLSASRLVLFILVAILSLRTYKAIAGFDQIDKFTFQPLPYKLNQLQARDTLSILFSVLLKNQSNLVHFWFIAINLIIICIAQIVPQYTLFIGFVNLIFLLEMIQCQIQEQRKKIRNKLGIKITNSIFVNQSQYAAKLEVPVERFKFSRSKRI